MTQRTYRAFVSSTFEDLKAHRAYVIEELRRADIDVNPMEVWPATAQEPKQFSMERVEGCDLCVLLVGFRRGFMPDGETRSITQMEYETALEKGIDVLVFLAKEDVPWPPQFYELKEDQRLKQWREVLQKKHVIEFFDYDPQSIDVAPSIARWIQARIASKSRPNSTGAQTREAMELIDQSQREYNQSHFLLPVDKRK